MPPLFLLRHHHIESKDTWIRVISKEGKIDLFHAEVHGELQIAVYRRITNEFAQTREAQPTRQQNLPLVIKSDIQKLGSNGDLWEANQ